MKKTFTLLVAMILTACLRLEAPTPEVSPQATNTTEPTHTETPTVVWFPPTETPAVTPTQEQTPTPDVLAELGEILYEDPFTSTEGWTLPQSGIGLVSIGNGELNIIINEPVGYLRTTREKPDLQEFFAEITISPILCSSRDEYGFLFSLYGGIQYYSFGLSCSGEVHLERYDNGSTTVLYPWARNASVPVGAPSVTRLAVLVVNETVHIYINGESLITIEGQLMTYGSFGVYARSVGDTAMTVSFSDFVIREVLAK
jgi:hypothetical protein